MDGRLWRTTHGEGCIRTRPAARREAAGSCGSHPPLRQADGRPLRPLRCARGRCRRRRRSRQRRT
ncbi:F-box protein-like [Iris pallida]|uniref:F-box protein-like n=1 Tax=Iris pallida TaxID=29817 RepID=A0AAX6IMC1_IRIPA|nr:F-box protein-like [Iris pallida]KAJ6854218.1 F-box protein-like [Iris pallida]